MLWKKKTEYRINGPMVTEDEVGAEAERLYRSGKMHCAEAVLAAVTNRFLPDAPEGIQALAAGFGGGSGSGCICGAVVGGTMAFGIVLHDRAATAALTKKLHEWFREEYGSICCRVIRNKDGNICPSLTGRVAAKTADLISERIGG